MITCGIQAPDRALQPKRRVSERKILGGGLKREPNPPQTVWRGEQIIFRDVIIVVPDETAVPRLPVEENCCYDENYRKQPEALRPRREKVTHASRGWALGAPNATRRFMFHHIFASRIQSNVNMSDVEQPEDRRSDARV